MRQLLTIACLSLALQSTALAADEAELREGPCNKLMEACKTYIKANAHKKSLYRDCMQPLLNNEKLDGITVAAADIKACQIKKAELKQKK